MKRYLIEDAKFEILSDVGPCGPSEETIVAFVKYKKEWEESKYLVLEEFEGFPQFYLFDKDPYDQITADPVDGDFMNYMLNHGITKIDGMELPNNYGDLYDLLSGCFSKHESNPLIRYIIALTIFDVKSTKLLIKNSVGKNLDEFHVPTVNELSSLNN